MKNRPLSRQTPFFDQLYREIEKHGGLFNAHLHLDRAGTLDDRYQQHFSRSVAELSYISLQEKHKRIHDIHAGPAYASDDLSKRVNFHVEALIEAGTRRGDTMVDVTADRVGLSALETLQEIRDRRRHEIEIRLGAYSPLGNTDHEPERWEILEKGAVMADFIGLLPEADDLADYPTHIGFEEHCKRGILLANSLGKMVHVHTDQRVLPGEDGTEQLVEVVRNTGVPTHTGEEPKIWVVHVVSPTTYEESRFSDLAKALAELNIGVICCPSAALGMRQVRQVLTPTDNSIPRVLEFLHHGVKVRIGSDNVADICSPSTTADLVDEIMILSAAVRFYHPEILAKLACGIDLDAGEIDFIGEHLARNKEEISKVRRFFS